jgi:EthD domain-containing protein
VKFFILIGDPVLDREVVVSAHVRDAVATLAEELRDVGLPGAQLRVGALSLSPFSAVPVAPSGNGPADTAPAAAVIAHLDDESLAPDVSARCWEVASKAGAIFVEEHIHTPEPPASHISSIVRLGFIVRHAGLSRQDFREHWLERHSPLVMAHTPLFDRYATNIPPADCPWDGIVEQWFADQSTWLEHDRRILEERPDVRADIPRFVGSLRQYVATPILFDDGAGG